MSWKFTASTVIQTDGDSWHWGHQQQRE